MINYFVNQGFFSCFRCQPGNKDTRLAIPYLTKTGSRTTAAYKAKTYLPNPVSPVELYEYRRDSQIQLEEAPMLKVNLSPLFFGPPPTPHFKFEFNQLCFEVYLKSKTQSLI